jgi:hypothetical protein
VANVEDSPECAGAYHCDSAAFCRSDSPFDTNSFELSGSLACWNIWHNCAADTSWFAARQNYPAPSGGSWNLRLHTAAFQSPCTYPGVYAQSQSLAVTPGRTYRVESWARNAGNAGFTVLLFFDSDGQQIGYHAAAWPTGAWEYHANPPVSGVAPANASFLQVRVGLTTAATYADFDLLAVYLDP